jgi:dTDP-4-dehydrorhamnose 3,5-epimerase
VIFHETALKGVRVIELQPRGDQRGWFARAWCREEFARHGIELEIAQGNASTSSTRGTLRGLHWQAAPHGEDKLVRCVRGAIFDVVVDVDPASPSYLRWIGVELTPSNQRMLFVPAACANGFQTLTDDTEVDYLVSVPYAPGSVCGLRYDDPTLAVSWPLAVTCISDQDRGWPLIEQASGRSTMSACRT